MATQTQTSKGNRTISWIPLVTVLLFIILAAVTASAILARGEAVTVSDHQRALDAWSARNQGLADYYAGKEAAQQRALDAWSARNQGLADDYAGKEAAQQRALDAWSARNQGLADYYLQQ